MTLLAFYSQDQQFVAQIIFKKKMWHGTETANSMFLYHMDNSKESGPEGMLSKLLKLPVTFKWYVKLNDQGIKQ
jgi:hypothetical protein